MFDQALVQQLKTWGLGGLIQLTKNYLSMIEVTHFNIYNGLMSDFLPILTFPGVRLTKNVIINSQLDIINPTKPTQDLK